MPNNGAYSFNFMLTEADSSLVLIMYEYREHSEGAKCSGGRVNEIMYSIQDEQFLD